ncbi:unannotated protein [freshwater metagenome]|uniref:Unannotated protein n=1 Tax=freshwater metagenome TaxID=449393 RepID=A0A6J7SM32_9ZZZZ
MTVHTISHIAINGLDADAYGALYVDSLGLNLVRRVHTNIEANTDAEISQAYEHETIIINNGERGVSIEAICRTIARPEDLPYPMDPIQLGVDRIYVQSANHEGDDVVITDPDGTKIQVSAGDRSYIKGIRMLVPDYQKSREFWPATLGLEVNDAPEGTEFQGFIDVRSGTDMFRIELEQSSLPVIPTNGYQLGAGRLAFTVDDVEATLERALATGAQEFGNLGRFELGPVTMVAGFWLEPSGVVIQALQFIKK